MTDLLEAYDADPLEHGGPLTEAQVAPALGDDQAWADLVRDPDQLAQVAAVLEGMRASLAAQYDVRALEDADHLKDARDGAISWPAYRERHAEFLDWQRRAGAFHDLVARRTAHVVTLVNERNRARRVAEAASRRAAHQVTETARAQENREAARQLATAIAEHRAQVTRTGAVCPADQALWAALEAISVPYRDGTATVAELLDGGAWSGPKKPRGGRR